MSPFTKFKWFLRYFGMFKVPMIGYTRPKLLELSDQKIVICIPLKRRTRNHLNSMYFGALAVDADMAGGFHGFYHASASGLKVSLVFKSFQAQFLSRPESDVYFVSTMGDVIKEMIIEAKSSGQRINKPISIKAYTDYLNQPLEVADFILELSIKVIN